MDHSRSAIFLHQMRQLADEYSRECTDHDPPISPRNLANNIENVRMIRLTLALAMIKQRRPGETAETVNQRVLGNLNANESDESRFSEALLSILVRTKRKEQLLRMLLGCVHDSILYKENTTIIPESDGSDVDLVAPDVVPGGSRPAEYGSMGREPGGKLGLLQNACPAGKESDRNVSLPVESQDSCEGEPARKKIRPKTSAPCEDSVGTPITSGMRDSLTNLFSSTAAPCRNAEGEFDIEYESDSSTDSDPNDLFRLSVSNRAIRRMMMTDEPVAPDPSLPKSEDDEEVNAATYGEFFEKLNWLHEMLDSPYLNDSHQPEQILGNQQFVDEMFAKLEIGIWRLRAPVPKNQTVRATDSRILLLVEYATKLGQHYRLTCPWFWDRLLQFYSDWITKISESGMDLQSPQIQFSYKTMFFTILYLKDSGAVNRLINEMLTAVCLNIVPYKPDFQPQPEGLQQSAVVLAEIASMLLELCSVEGFDIREDSEAWVATECRIKRSYALVPGRYFLIKNSLQKCITAYSQTP